MDMMCWVINTEENIPPFILSRAGYDVWLTNSRGNRFSESHISLDSSSKEFWSEVDWEQMGTKDTPAVIEYILNITGRS